MKYLAILHAPAGIHAEGIHSNESDAIAMAFVDSHTVRNTPPSQIALCMYHLYDDGVAKLSYATTYAKYLVDTSNA